MKLPDLPWEPVALAAAAAVVLSRASVGVKRLTVLAAAGGGLAYALSGGFDRLSLPGLAKSLPEKSPIELPALIRSVSPEMPSIDWCAIGLCSVPAPLRESAISIWPHAPQAPGISYYQASTEPDASAGRVRGYAVRYPLQVRQESTQDHRP